MWVITMTLSIEVSGRWGGRGRRGCLKLDVQSQRGGRSLDVDGKGGWEVGGSWTLDNFHGRHMCIIPKMRFAKMANVFSLGYFEGLWAATYFSITWINAHVIEHFSFYLTRSIFSKYIKCLDKQYVLINLGEISFF